MSWYHLGLILYLEPFLDSVLSIFIDSDDIRCPATSYNHDYANRYSYGMRPALLTRGNHLKLQNVSRGLNATASLCVSVWMMETLNASAVNLTSSNKQDLRSGRLDEELQTVWSDTCMQKPL